MIEHFLHGRGPYWIALVYTNTAENPLGNGALQTVYSPMLHVYCAKYSMEKEGGRGAGIGRGRG